MLKLLHISDIHLEAKFGFLGDKASQARGAIVKAFERSIDEAISNNVHFLIISGDLFDTPYPSQTAIDIVKKGIKKLEEKGIYTVIIPGNHDYLAAGSVYLSPEFSEGLNKLILFNNPKEIRRDIVDLNLSLYAKPNDTSKSLKSPIVSNDEVEQSKNEFDAQYKICIAHGSYEMGNGEMNYPIKKEDIANSKFDYIALGDWHGTKDVSHQDHKAFYPGSLEPLAIDQKSSGKALLVTVEKTTTVEEIQIGKINCEKLEIDITQAENIISIIEKNLDNLIDHNKNYMIQVDLIGDRDLQTRFEFEKIIEYFEEKYFFIKFNDKTKLKLTDLDLANYPDYTIIGKFIQNLRKRDDVDSGLIDQAIHKGVNLLDRE